MYRSSEMNISEILEELSQDRGDIPREAIESAIANSCLITPYLLQILENAIENVESIIENDSDQAHLYAMYLLAQFREEKAYSLLIELFSFPGEMPYAIAGDVLTEDLSRIFASVCDKNIEPLQTIIETPTINEYVRSAAQSCLVVLVGCGRISRACAIQYFKELFHHRLEKKPSFVWDNLIACCCALHPEDTMEEILHAYEENLINLSFFTKEEVFRTQKKEKQAHLFELHQNVDLIEDTVSEMEKWLFTNSPT